MPVHPARQHHLQAPLYFRKAISYDSDDVSTGIFIGKMPAGSIVVSVDVRPVTVFNGTGTVTLTLGTTAGGDDIVASSEVGISNDLKSALPVQYTARPHFTDEESIYATVVDENSDSTAGSFIVAVAYIQNNDG